MCFELPFEALGFGMNDKKIVFGVCPGGKDRVTRLLRMVKEGRIDPSPMTTHEFTFCEVEKAFEMMSNKTDDIVKPLIEGTVEADGLDLLDPEAVQTQGLVDHDVDVCFTNPGTSEMHFVAALDGEPRMQAVLGLFEGVVTGAADGYARMSGRPEIGRAHV